MNDRRPSNVISSPSWVLSLIKWLHRFLLTKDAEAKLPSGAKVSIIELGSGYLAPQPPIGVEESRDLSHMHSKLKERYLVFKADFEVATGYRLKETCVWRSKEKQAKLFAIGRTKPGSVVTQCDGTVKKSRHNVFPSQAVDVAVLVNGTLTWDFEKYYKAIGPLALKHGLRWGGSWLGWKDYPHLELPPGVADV